MEKKIKVLNGYAGIGGNRWLWENVEVTAIEKDKDIAKIYQDFFPNDKVIVTDAHKYLLEHYKEFDFIWLSPPCPTHSRMNDLLVKGKKSINARYPDMKLYEEIVLLKHFCKCKWVIENVKSYYEPLIKPYETQRHYFWSNFHITDNRCSKKVRNDKGSILTKKMSDRGIIVKNFHNYKGDKRTLINNCIEPKLGLHIFKEAFKNKQKKVGDF